MKVQNFFTAVHLRDECALVFKGYTELMRYLAQSWGELYIDCEGNRVVTANNLQDAITSGDLERGVLLFSGKYTPVLKIQYQTLELI